MKEKVISGQRSGFLDMLKMICVIMIVITHVSWSEAERTFFVFPFIIDMAVPIFMIIYSYLRAQKIDRVGFKNFISPKSSLKSLGSFMVAYIMVAVLEIVMAVAISGFDLGVDFSYIESPLKFFKWFFTGLTGPGSYYIPILVQLLIYYPLIWLLVKKMKSIGLFTCFALNFVYEIAVYQCNMDALLYRLLVFRYTFLIALGIYFSMTEKRKRDDITALVFLIAGVLFITVNSYVRPFTLFQDWKSTSMLCVPFAYGSMYFLKKYFGDISYNKIFIVGKASLHIYLTQMVFFGFGGGRILRMIFQSMPGFLSGMLGSAIAILVCVPIGIVFFGVESRLRKIIFKSKRKNDVPPLVS